MKNLKMNVYFSASKRDRLSKFVRSPSVEEVDDDDGATAASGFVVSETIGHYVDAEGNQVEYFSRTLKLSKNWMAHKNGFS